MPTAWVQEGQSVATRKPARPVTSEPTKTATQSTPSIILSFTIASNKGELLLPVLVEGQTEAGVLEEVPGLLGRLYVRVAVDGNEAYH